MAFQYFSKFPQISYDFTQKSDATPLVELVTDLTTRIDMVISDSDFANMCERYTIKSGELPEHVSNMFYGTPDLAWTIFYINSLTNINEDWPMSDIELNNFASAKYGSANLLNIHHYEKLPEGVIMDYQFIVDHYGAQSVNPITNLDHEIFLNEQKRMIYVIKQENIAFFVSKYMKLVQQ